MEKLWQIDDPAKRQPIIDNNLLGSMSAVIGKLAQFLVKQPIGLTALNAGPPFRDYEFTGNALNDLKACVKAAADAYPDDIDLKSVKEKVDTFVDLPA